MKVGRNLKPEDRLIVALDLDSAHKARDLFHQTKHYAHTFKIGLELFTALGPALLDTFNLEGINVFLDLKLHDIPTTVAAAIKRAAEHRVQMLTIHALGGPKMLERAALAIEEIGADAPELLAVSVLTHHDEDEIHQIGFSQTTQRLVSDLLEMSFRAGVRGCVCSPQEAAAVRELFGEKFVIVCPGVRPLGIGQDDQMRVATPFDTIKNGADYIVVGRPITRATSPADAAKSILNEIIAGLNARK